MVSPGTADELFRGSGLNTEEYISKSADSYVKPQADLTGKKIYLKTTVKTETVLVRNVIGIIEGKDPSQIIVAGAHYDHMGMWNGYVWNGADDNGSGTVGIMTIAKAVMETGVKPEKTIIIALWAAEEEGLLGSRHFVANLPFPANNIRLNLNFDMISRYVSEKEYKKAYMVYTDAYPGFKTMTEKNLKSYGIDLDVEYQPSADPPGGSDHRSFVDAGIPILRFKPGHREEYHTPADDISTVDWDIMLKIVRIGFANIWELANSKW
jgi:Zn-dependent M28 family amino/carboxypeptidase